jgi:hypothetical protein
LGVFVGSLDELAGLEGGAGADERDEMRGVDRAPAVLGLPGLGQLGDHRCGQPGRAAQELAERGHEVAGGQSVQVQERQHLGDLLGLAAPRRQDRRGEPAPLARLGVGAAVVDPRRDHLDRPGAGEHLAGLVGAVAHDQPPAGLVALARELGDVGVDLGLQGFGEHPAGTLTHDLVDQTGRTGRTTHGHRHRHLQELR